GWAGADPGVKVNSPSSSLRSSNRLAMAEGTGEVGGWSGPSTSVTSPWSSHTRPSKPSCRTRSSPLFAVDARRARTSGSGNASSDPCRDTTTSEETLCLLLRQIVDPGLSGVPSQLTQGGSGHDRERRRLARPHLEGVARLVDQHAQPVGDRRAP